MGSELPYIWQVVMGVAQIAGITTVIVVIRKTRFTRKIKKTIEDAVAAGEIEKMKTQFKIGFAEAMGKKKEKRTKRLPLWSNIFRKIRRLFPSRRLFYSFKANGFPCVYFFDYCPDRDDRGPRDARNREMILSFKDGDNKNAVFLVTEFIFRYIPKKDLENWVFCVIPASTRKKNENRNYDFCEKVSTQTGILNGFSEIKILYDRTDSREHKEDDTVWNLQFGVGVEGKHVILFDDIITRGISFIQCAEKLKSKGAVSITGLFLGKTLR